MKEAPKTVRLMINGRSVEAKPSTTVFKAAELAGIFIPHYCYHPDLSIAGACRMCLVDIEKIPKLQISCNTPVAEGMVVKTSSAKVNAAVKGVLELHLINHPLDCPICDKAGECKLQDFYVQYGLYSSRMDYEKVHKPKVVDIGTIMLDSERCILCTRCVRFTSEVTKTHELGIFNRGDRSELKTYDGGPLRNDYTGNLADICPVGALTAKDFRFQCRVWFLEKTKSVCTQCARGCNTLVSVNPSTKKLYRIEPRRNPEVNQSWICDQGRWDYHYVHEKRVRTPLLNEEGVLVEVTWQAFFGVLRERIVSAPREVLIGLSTHMTNEEVVDAVMTLGALGVKHFTWIVDERAVADRRPFDGVLKHRDATSNAQGVELVFSSLGIPLLKMKELTKAYQPKNPLILCLGLEGNSPPGVAELLSVLPPSVNLFVHTTSVLPYFEACQGVIPNVSSFEKTGTIINALGRLQKVNASIPRQFTARDVHAVAFGVFHGNDREQSPPGRGEDLFKSVISAKIVKDSMNWRQFNPMGLELEPSLLQGAK